MERDKYSVGRLIKSIRTSLHLSQSKVCGGLCSLNAFVRMEKGEIEPNPYLVSLFFERMGIDKNKYGLVYSKKEYRELELRCMIIKSMKESPKAKLQELLYKYQNTGKKSKYKEQFICYAKLIGDILCESSHMEFFEKGIEVIRLTIPEFELTKVGAYRYSRIERALIVYIADKLFEAGQKQRSIQILKELLLNMERMIQDPEEMVHGYPEITCILVEKLWNEGCYGELSFCEKAIQLLYGCQKLNGVLFLLKYRLNNWKNDNDCGLLNEEISKWEKRIIALEQLEKEKEISEFVSQDVYSLLIEESIQGVPLGDLLKSVRYSIGTTGEKVSEQICEPESYSRVERGVTKPNIGIYQNLMKRMGKEGYRYYPNVVSEDYGVHLLYREMVRCIGSFHYESAKEVLDKLEERLNMQEKLNKQSIQYNKTSIEINRKGIDVKRAEEDLWKCLWITLPEKTDWRRYPLNHLETVIVNGIAIVYGEQGEVSKAIDILLDLRTLCEKNPLFMLNNKLLYFLVSYNLVHYLNAYDDYVRAAQISDECEWLAGQEGASYDFLSFCYFKIWNEEQLLVSKGEETLRIQEICLPEFVKIALAAEAVGQNQIKDFISKHCERIYGVSIG